MLALSAMRSHHSSFDAGLASARHAFLLRPVGRSGGSNPLAPVTGLLNTVTSGLTSATGGATSGSGSAASPLAPVTGLLGGLTRH